MNFVFISGHLGQDAEKRGDNFFTFSVATTESYKDKSGEWQQSTAWHNVNAYNLSDHKFNRLKKGVKVIVQGKIAYKDNFTNIIAQKIEIVDKPTKQPKKQEQKKDDDGTTFNYSNGSEVDDEHLPF